jgi:hypothetical protein
MARGASNDVSSNYAVEIQRDSRVIDDVHNSDLDVVAATRQSANELENFVRYNSAGWWADLKHIFLAVLPDHLCRPDITRRRPPSD